MLMLKLKVDGGTGYAYVNAEEISAVMPGAREMDGGATIMFRASESGINVMESPEEVIDAINAEMRAVGEGVHRVTRIRDGS